MMRYYQSKGSHLALCCIHNHLTMNIENMIVGTKHLLIINDSMVERVTSTKFLCMHLTEALIWQSNANFYPPN